ncbi:MAG: heme A synthase, partial [Hyphomicrobiales bacterium]|nr:heme A synthase [Hyphomicrobiales bacterium]
MSRSLAPVRWWLVCVALLVIVMILIGGATRLTDSGLSITEWQPIHGVIPPLNQAEWQEEFAKYQQIPEYQLINKGMSLAAFKTIFWWEWGHRFLGRIIGVVFLVPLIWFWATGRIHRSLMPKLIVLFVLGGLQGAIGWWMVASGLSQRTDVSQYRLAIHLTLACAILAALLWVAGSLQTINASSRALRVGATIVVILVFAQIFLGGLVAGLDAGLVSDSWPLMNGDLVPPGLLVMRPLWLNFFENAATVHFDHRLVGYLLLAATLIHAWQARGTPYAKRSAILCLAVAGQAGVGIANVLAAVPLWLALVHQFGAVVVLALAIANLRAMTPA